MRMRALTEGPRAALLHRRSDRSRHAGRHGRTKAGRSARALLKAWGTDTGCEVATLGVQVHGGMGFIEETGAAQFYRDARIAPIYEGTNGIQAADLVTRKLGYDNGGVVRRCLKTSLPTVRKARNGEPCPRRAGNRGMDGRW
jgi:alkylation response protein AidB-like acyl-CoA dehydrogenase